MSSWRTPKSPGAQTQVGHFVRGRTARRHTRAAPDRNHSEARNNVSSITSIAMTSGPTSSCHCPPSHLLEHLDDFPIVVLWLIALNRQRHRHHIQFAVLPVFRTGSRRIRKCATYIVEEAEVLDMRIVVSLIHVQPHEVVVFIPANGVYKTRKRLTLKLPVCDDLQDGHH